MMGICVECEMTNENIFFQMMLFYALSTGKQIPVM